MLSVANKHGFREVVEKGYRILWFDTLQRWSSSAYPSGFSWVMGILLLLPETQEHNAMANLSLDHFRDQWTPYFSRAGIEQFLSFLVQYLNRSKTNLSWLRILNKYKIYQSKFPSDSRKRGFPFISAPLADLFKWLMPQRMLSVNSVWKWRLL